MASAIRNDLTVGNVVKQLAAFSVPTLLANILQSLYGLADMIIVGQFVGEAGLSATGLCSEVMIVISATSTGICTGGTVILARYMGLHDDAGQKYTISTLFILMLAVSAALTAIGLALTPLVVRLMQTPVEAVTQAVSYLRWSCGGIVFIFGYNTVCAVFRGLGNSKIPMYVIGAAAVLNVLLDLVFVGVFGMDAGGAALATVIAQGISFIWALVLLLSKGRLGFKFDRSNFRYDAHKAALILKVGVPNMLQTMLVHISMVVVGAMISTYGLTASAASGIGQKMSSISVLARQAVSAGVSTMVGQNMAGSEYSRVVKIVKTGVFFSLAANFVLFIFVSVFPEFVAGLFTKEVSVIAEAKIYLRIVSVSYLIMAPMTIFNALAIGVGDSRRSMLNSLLDSIICRVPLCFILGWLIGLKGIYYAMAFSALSAVMSGYVYFISDKWKDNSIRTV